MRDRRDYVILGLAGAMLFCLGLLLGRGGLDLPAATAQDGGAETIDPTSSTAPDGSTVTGGDGVSIAPNPLSTGRPDLGSRTTAPTASDSNSNNRFVAVTTPVGSGESVTFILDSRNEQLLVYRFVRSKGLQLVAARKIDYDLRLSAYKDVSEYTRDEMKSLFQRQRAREAAKKSK